MTGIISEESKRILAAMDEQGEIAMKAGAMVEIARDIFALIHINLEPDLCALIWAQIFRGRDFWPG